MSNPERLKKLLPAFAEKSRKTGEQVTNRLKEFRATNPEHGKVTKIKIYVGRNLDWHGIEDPETNQLTFIGRSQPHSYIGVSLDLQQSGFKPKDARKVEKGLKKMKPIFWVAASVQLPESKFKRFWSTPPTLYSKRGDLTVNYGQYPLQLQIAVEETGEVKRLDFPPGLRLSKEDKQRFTEMLPLLSVIENVTNNMQPIKNPAEFPSERFLSQDTDTFLFPKLS